MRTDFLRITAGIACALVLGVYAYAKYLDNAYILDSGKKFYFVVSESTHIEAGTQFIELSGGAGYTLIYEGKPYAAYAAYLFQSGGEYAENAVKDAKTLVISTAPLCFKTKEGKRNSAKIMGGMETLYGCIKVLEGEISRLESGATQESSKCILRVLEKQFTFLRQEYEKLFPSYATTCANAAKALEEMQQGIIYASRLRHLQCVLCDSYVHLSETFSL